MSIKNKIYKTCHYAVLTGIMGASQWSCSEKASTTPSRIGFAEEQFKVAFEEIDKSRRHNTNLIAPRSLRNDTLFLVPVEDWTSGFFAGNLWWMYESTGDEFWKEKAIEFTEPLEPLKNDTGTHDLGFMLYNSFGKGYQLTGNEEYRNILLAGANSLKSRFDDRVGAIRSWDFSRDKWDFPVIIDNMMNLEYLFWATKVTGDSSYYKIADSHAEVTLANHFRGDHSSFHVIDYDSSTGKVRNKHTHQGHAHESAWARGQAWGLYGYVMCYRETGKEKYLEMAQNIARLMLDHENMPEDLVPYWDYDAPDIPDAPRDASAAAVMASALLELDNYVSTDNDYREKALTVIDNLTQKYRSHLGDNYGFLLMHSTGHLPGKHEVDVPLVYADYYYLEALHRVNELHFTSQQKIINTK